MRIVLISTPIGFLGSGKGGGVELTLNSLVSGLLSLGHSVEVIAPSLVGSEMCIRDRFQIGQYLIGDLCLLQVFLEEQ